MEERILPYKLFGRGRGDHLSERRNNGHLIGKKLSSNAGKKRKGRRIKKGKLR